MRRPVSFSLLFLISIATAVVTFAQQPTASSAPLQRSVPMVAPLFIENGELSSMVTIVNHLKDEHPATLVLTDPDGAEIARQDLLIQGHTNQVIQIHDLLSAVGRTRLLVPFSSQPRMSTLCP